VPPLGVDAISAALAAGACPGWHPQLAVAVLAGRVGGVGCRSPVGVQRGEQQRAARVGHIGVPVRKEPDHGAVGQLFAAPSRPECFEQVVTPTGSIKLCVRDRPTLERPRRTFKAPTPVRCFPQVDRLNHPVCGELEDQRHFDHKAPMDPQPTGVYEMHRDNCN
jgi:hypothetical protein